MKMPDQLSPEIFRVCFQEASIIMSKKQTVNLDTEMEKQKQIDEIDCEKLF